MHLMWIKKDAQGWQHLNISKYYPASFTPEVLVKGQHSKEKHLTHDYLQGFL